MLWVCFRYGFNSCGLAAAQERLKAREGTQVELTKGTRDTTHVSVLSVRLIDGFHTELIVSQAHSQLHYTIILCPYFIWRFPFPRLFQIPITYFTSFQWNRAFVTKCSPLIWIGTLSRNHKGEVRQRREFACARVASINSHRRHNVSQLLSRDCHGKAVINSCILSRNLSYLIPGFPAIVA